MTTAPPGRTDQTGADRRIYALLVLAVFAVYANAFGNHFLYDDHHLILDNIFLRAARYLPKIFLSSVTGGSLNGGGYYRPLPVLLYFIAYQAGGPAPFFFHLLSISLHAINACLAFRLGRVLGLARPALIAGVLIWALHPIQTEAVTYMSGVPDTLYSMFCLLALIRLLPEATPRAALRACPWFVCALLSKESAVILPLLASACVFFVSPERRKSAAYLRLWPLWVVAGLYVVLRLSLMDQRLFAVRFENPYAELYAAHMIYRIYTFLATLPAYAGLLLWPTGLHMERVFPVYLTPWAWPVAGGAILVALALAQLAWGEAGRGRALSWALLWFAAAHLVETGIFWPMNPFFYEHWMYLPSLGLFIGAVDYLWARAQARFQDRIAASRIALGFAGIIVLTLAICTYRQNAVWHDDFVFFENILVTNHEPAPRAYNELGLAYLRQGDVDHAMKEFRAALRISDTLPEIHENIAALLMLLPDQKSHAQDAIAELRRAIALNPDYFEAYSSLTYIYGHVLGDREQEAVCRKKAEEILKKFTS